MKNLFLCLIFLCLPLALHAQGKTAVVSPEQPKIGDEITITYNTDSETATLKDPSSVAAELLCLSADDTPVLKEIAMTRKGKAWTANATLEKSCLLFLLRFSSGDEVDDNGENSWMTMVTAGNGKPVKNALFMRAIVLRYGDYYGFKHQKDLDGAKKSLDAELKAFPDNVKAMSLRWVIMIREAKTGEAKTSILKDVDQQFAKFEKTPAAIGEFIGAYQQLGRKDKAEEIKKKVMEGDPKGKIAKDARLSALYEMMNIPEKKAQALPEVESFLRDFPGDKQAQSYRLRIYKESGDVEQAIGYLDMVNSRDGMEYNSIAWPLIEKGENLEKAVAWAKKGIELLRRPDPKDKPAYVSMKAWQKNNDFALGMILDTYAFGLSQLDRKDEALAAYEEAVQKSGGGDADMNEHYMLCLKETDRIEQSLTFGRECIMKAKSNDKIVECCKAAFTKRGGSESEFDTWLADAKKAAREEVRKSLKKEMMDKPSIDFTLKRLGGPAVSLAALKGKVVILDFWATWCGPCKASFPSLQKIHDKFKDNPNVMFLVADTWEKETGDEKEKLVKKFVDDNKYTFPVVFDEGFVEKYGVTGIPTKFVIDKEGKIRFRTIGFGGAAQMEEELTAQIEMLL
jgi:thiol-disulfide isomerase/thioredoxin